MTEASAAILAYNSQDALARRLSQRNEFWRAMWAYRRKVEAQARLAEKKAL
jgi:predicted deacetylase